jgi:hypothetical protein
VPQIHAESSALIDAAPEKVYGIIRDYNNGHPRMLPAQYFRDLKVEAGGEGAGTIITFQTTVGGQTRSFRGHIEEPEPGRVLVERYDDGSVTTFTITPAGGGQQSNVKITTDWNGSIVEKLFAPGMLRKVYDAEPQQLNGVVKE